MNKNIDYLQINRKSWNNRVETHMKSAFYDLEGFLKGNTSLKSIELELLGDITNKDVLHLQCHFGQDSISLARMGANVTGIDLSDLAIAKANELALQCNVAANFVCSDVYELPNHLSGQFDLVFASYGTIGWLPDLKRWANTIDHFLKPGGQFILVEFHPVVWIFDDNFESIVYNYFNTGAIMENESGTYANKEANIQQDFVMWNHSLDAIIGSLLTHNLQLTHFQEFNYSPYPCFNQVIEYESGKYKIKHLEDKIPMVFSLQVLKP